jgi:hypothetical protein
MGNSSSGVAEIKGKSDVANLNAALAAREAANHAAGSANNMRRSVSSKRFKKGGDGATQWRVSLLLVLLIAVPKEILFVWRFAQLSAKALHKYARRDCGTRRTQCTQRCSTYAATC